MNYVLHDKWYKRHLEHSNIWEIKEFDAIVKYVVRDQRQHWKEFLTEEKSAEIPKIKESVKRNLNIKKKLEVTEIEYKGFYIIGITYMRMKMGEELDNVIKLFQQGFLAYKKVWEEKMKPENIKQMELLLSELRKTTSSSLKENITADLFEWVIKSLNNKL